MDDHLTEIVNSPERLPEIYEKIVVCEAKVREVEEVLVAGDGGRGNPSTLRQTTPAASRSCARWRNR
jgi:hypothetical protein